nr:MAG TPA: hypothetical protein [Caudoviricetes sp.]
MTCPFLFAIIFRKRQVFVAHVQHVGSVGSYRSNVHE